MSKKKQEEVIYTTYNMWCPNCLCGKKGKERDFKMEISNQENPDFQICPNFKPTKKQTYSDVGFLKVLGQQIFGGLLKFSGKSLTLQEKQRLLKKRATNHYNKEIKDRKNEMNKKAFGKGI